MKKEVNNLSFLVQPAIQGVLAEFLSALVIIGIGIYLEYKGLDRASVVLNLGGLIVFAFTTQMDILVIPLLGLYFFFGMLIAIFKVKKLYGLFGSKVYGSLLLIVAVFQLPSIQNPIYEMLIVSQASQEAMNTVLIFFYGLLLFSWFMTCVFVWIFARILKPKKH
jgi:hypothetical protein